MVRHGVHTGVVAMFSAKRLAGARVAGAALLVSLGVMMGVPLAQAGCMPGEIAAAESAQFVTDLPEQYMSGTIEVDLQTDAREMTLTVTDPDGNNVCENTENLTRSCTWTPNNRANFIVKIENIDTQLNSYNLCWQE
jgi:hypothetical protein